jgi:hypothetical protein
MISLNKLEFTQGYPYHIISLTQLPSNVLSQMEKKVLEL